MSFNEKEYLNEAFNELKQLKEEYQLNPNDVELAINYSNKLKSLMNYITIKPPSMLLKASPYSNDEIIACRELLKPLTEVYQRHSRVEEVAVSYLYTICLPLLISEKAIDRMMEIVMQFPKNDLAKYYCAHGLSLIVSRYTDRNDLANAERIIT